MPLCGEGERVSEKLKLKVKNGMHFGASNNERQCTRLGEHWGIIYRPIFHLPYT